MGKKSTPSPPDLGPYVRAMDRQGRAAEAASAAQLAWAREQAQQNQQTLDRVLGTQLPIMEEQAQNARTDRARYEQVYQPIENQLISDFQTYGTPERMQQERGRAGADVAGAFDAQRRNALQRLEGFGIDPSQTRNAALDIGMRTTQAAASAGAQTNATRIAEDKARAMRADAINIGRGMPSQVAQSYGQAAAAGSQGVGGANSTLGASSGAMGNPTSWAGLGQSGAQGAANITNSGFQNQMSVANLQQQQNAALMSGLGSAAGMAMMMADGGSTAIPPGPVDQGPTDGSGIDDQVHAKLSVGEYVIPADVVQKKGVEFFDKLLEKYHTPAAEQQQQPSWRHAVRGGT